MDFFVWLFDFQVHSLLWSFVLLAAAISLIALGVILTVSMALAPNPADGFVDAVARALGVEFSRAKNIFDIRMAGLTCIISLAATGGIVGVGAGTVLSALLIGPTAGLMKRRLFPLLGSQAY